jgi:cytochrome P450
VQLLETLAHRDYFTDHDILKDPYSFFEAVRAEGTVYQPPGKDYLIVTGFAETLEILNNHRDFSSAVAVQGAAAALPFTPEGADIAAQVALHQSEFLGGDLVVNLDDERHQNLRSLVNKLFTPSRLRANEAFITDYSDRLVREMVARGGCDLIAEVATPYVTLVIADLLGVPAEDRQLFMDAIDNGPPAGSLDATQNDFSNPNHPLVVMGGYFLRYVMERQAAPRDDLLSELANAEFPDGSKPSILDIVSLATFLFGAGQDTSAKLLGNTMSYIIDQPGLQAQLRADPSQIPALMEEVLRIEGSTKMTSRLCRRDTTIGGMPVRAGTKILVALSAANRDPERWECPADLQLGRPRIKEHLAFGRGKHVCAGAPLARVEVRIILEKFLEHTAHIDLDPAHHGPPGDRGLDYDPSFIIRGLSALHITLEKTS